MRRAMSSKNNPENRGQVTELRVYNKKKVKPVLYINPEANLRFMAAVYENNELACPPGSKIPVAYQQV